MSFFIDLEKTALQLDSRRKIYRVVEEFAGSHYREVLRKSDMSAGVVKYHLDYLVKHGLIKNIKKGRTSAYFLTEPGNLHEDLLLTLRQEITRKIILFLLINDKNTHEELVGYLGVSPSAVSWHLKKLVDGHIIKIGKQGRKYFYSISYSKDEIISVLIRYKESFFDSLVNKVIEMWEFP